MAQWSVKVIDRLVQWAGAEPLVRTLLLTSTRANPNAPLDPLSDYDVILVVSDFRTFSSDEAWPRWYGVPLVLLREGHVSDGIERHVRLVLYEDGTKIDYTVCPVAYLEKVLEAPLLDESLDVGYRVLVDKDGLTRDLKPPTYTAHIPCRPTAGEYLALVEEFWWETTYVAKNLWRDELLPAKYSFDAVIKLRLLRTMLEWSIEIDHSWSLGLGAYGRRLKTLLTPEVWAEVESTFVGADIEGNWEALFRTAALFRRIASSVATDLGYEYPRDLDRGVMRYLSGLKELRK